VGRDEQYAFIAMLPEKATSVKHAHEILRPKGLPANSQRQGEWFFAPVGKILAEKLDRIAKTDPDRVMESPLERGSTHIAKQFLNYQHEKYVVGYVNDSRVTRHKGIFLSGWHRVVRNRERVIPKLSNQRVRFD